MFEEPITAMCLAPFGMEEGTLASLPPHELGVIVGEPVRFRFFGSSTRREDAPGTELERWKDGELEELSPIEVTLPADRVVGPFSGSRLRQRGAPSPLRRRAGRGLGRTVPPPRQIQSA